MKNKSAAPIEPQAPANSQVEVTPVSARPKKSRRKIALIALAVIILVGLAAFLHHRSANNSETKKAGTVFTVDGKDYNQAEVKSLIAYPTVLGGETSGTATKGVYFLLQYKAAAEGMGIKFTDSQLRQNRQQRGSTLYKQSDYESYLNLLAYKTQTVQYINDQISNTTNGYFSGYSFVFHFDETLSYGPAYKSPNYGNKTLLARDKKYALSKANSYHTQLSQNKITPAKALAQIVADPRLGYYYKANNNYSSQFGASSNVNWQRQVFFPPIASFIQKQTKPGLSAIQTGKVSIVPDPALSSDYADGYYYFVLVTQAQPKPKDPHLAFQQSMTNVSKHSKYYGAPHD